MSGTLAFSDLDRTLIYSVSALGVPAAEAPPLRLVETYDGRPLSFTTERAARALEAAAAPIVPVTTRTVQQYRRVRLPGPPPRWAVCTNGARVLIDGEEHEGWTREVARALPGASHDEMLAVLRERAAAADDAVLRVHEAEGVFSYAIVDRARLPGAWTADLAAHAARVGWRVSVQGRKLYCVPAALTKSAAAAWIAERAGAERWVAAGDSLLDADLLDAAAEGVLPAHGELAATGWTRPHVAVAPGTGVLAGEWIATWLLRRAAGA